MSRKSRELAKATERDAYAPISSLREEIDRLFDDFTGWPFSLQRRPGRPAFLRGRGMGEGFPDIDVIDRKKSFEIRAELPGVDEKDIDLRILDDAVVLKAEKREERTEGEEDGDFYVSECRYGALQRVIPLPPGVDTGESDATFRKGVLRVKFAKHPEQHESARRIEVRAG